MGLIELKWLYSQIPIWDLGIGIYHGGATAGEGGLNRGWKVSQQVLSISGVLNSLHADSKLKCNDWTELVQKEATKNI